MRKLLSLSLLICFCQVAVLAQGTDYPEFQLEKSETEGHVKFLADDKLLGRKTGGPGNDMAADYIAGLFKEFGLKTAPGFDHYFQEVPFKATAPAKNGTVKFQENTYTQGEDLIVMSDAAFDLDKGFVFAKYGLVDETNGTDHYEGLDVNGKIVVLQVGVPGSTNAADYFGAIQQKRKIAAEKGAVAIVELYNTSIPWNMLRGYLMNEMMVLDASGTEEGSLPYCWVYDQGNNLLKEIQASKGKNLKMSSDGMFSNRVVSNNVIGWIEGTDPRLKDEYVLLCAHFDHVGAGPSGGQVTEEDSIFNGARDNAMGTAALLAAAKSIAKKPTARSVVFLALTGEEIGLLGSKFYVEHPAFPLKQTVFVLNNDGAGYTDTDIVAVTGLKRVGAEKEIIAGAKAAGLGVFPDPSPEQNLFDRSDNVNFAAKGIPAPTFSPGFKAFNEEMFKNYHQVSDEAGTVDYAYLLKFAQAYTHAARLIANKKDRPQWVEGDKYEQAGKKLYGQ